MIEADRIQPVRADDLDVERADSRAEVLVADGDGRLVGRVGLLGSREVVSGEHTLPEGNGGELIGQDDVGEVLDLAAGGHGVDELLDCVLCVHRCITDDDEFVEVVAGSDVIFPDGAAKDLDCITIAVKKSELGAGFDYVVGHRCYRLSQEVVVVDSRSML